MKIIKLACEQIPVPRVKEEIIFSGSNRITIAEEQLTSYFKVKVIGKNLVDIVTCNFPRYIVKFIKIIRNILFRNNSSYHFFHKNSSKLILI
jgi:hypothetical protein